MSNKSTTKYEQKNSETAKQERGERLRYALNLANLKPSNIQKSYGLSRNTLYSWIKGQHSGLTTQGAKRIVTILKDSNIQCTIGWLMSGHGARPTFAQPIDSEAAQINSAGNNHANNEMMHTELELYYEHCAIRGKQPLSAELDSDAVEPYYHKGDIVAGEKIIGTDILQLISKICIIELEDGNIVVRYLKKGDNFELFSAIPTNLESEAEYLHNKRIIGAAKISRHWVNND